MALGDIYLRVALGDIYLRFAWQVWHSWHWAGSGGVLGPDWSLVTPWRFAWQAWDLATSTFISRGRHGTWKHPLSFSVPGSGATLGLGLVAGTLRGRHLELSTFVLRGRRGTIFDTPSFTHTIFDTPSFTHHLSHTPSFTHNFVTRSLSHRTFTHTIFRHTIRHTPFCHTPSFMTPSFTHNFVTHHLSPHPLSHTTLSQTIFRPTIFHTPSFTHNFVTRSLSRAHHLSHTALSQTHTHTPSSSSHAIFHIQLCHTQLCFTCRSSTTSFVFPSFPLRYNIWCSLLEERLGLSGPLILVFLQTLMNLCYSHVRR